MSDPTHDWDRHAAAEERAADQQMEAEEIARRFMQERKRLAPHFGQTIAVPDWDELPEGLRELTVAAMACALFDDEREEGDED